MGNIFTSQKSPNFRQNYYRRRTENFFVIKIQKKPQSPKLNQKKIQEIETNIQNNLKIINKTNKTQNGLKEILYNVQKKVFTLSTNFKEIKKIKRFEKNFKIEEDEILEEKTKRKYNKNGRRNKISKRKSRKEKELETDSESVMKKK